MAGMAKPWLSELLEMDAKELDRAMAAAAMVKFARALRMSWEQETGALPLARYRHLKQCSKIRIGCSAYTQFEYWDIAFERKARLRGNQSSPENEMRWRESTEEFAQDWAVALGSIFPAADYAGWARALSPAGGPVWMPESFELVPEDICAGELALRLCPGPLGSWAEASRLEEFCLGLGRQQAPGRRGERL